MMKYDPFQQLFALFFFFLADSLRLLQHVETIRVPTSWESVESKTWKELTWEDKRFEVCEHFNSNIRICFELLQ